MNREFTNDKPHCNVAHAIINWLLYELGIILQMYINKNMTISV